MLVFLSSRRNIKGAEMEELFKCFSEQLLIESVSFLIKCLNSKLLAVSLPFCLIELLCFVLYEVVVSFSNARTCFKHKTYLPF